VRDIIFLENIVPQIKTPYGIGYFQISFPDQFDFQSGRKITVDLYQVCEHTPEVFRIS
jgi:hypothetical protein